MILSSNAERGFDGETSHSYLRFFGDLASCASLVAHVRNKRMTAQHAQHWIDLAGLPLKHAETKLFCRLCELWSLSHLGCLGGNDFRLAIRRLTDMGCALRGMQRDGKNMRFAFVLRKHEGGLVINTFLPSEHCRTINQS